MPRAPSLRPPVRSAALAIGEVVLAVAAATAVVAALEPSTPATGLGMLYLLAVLAVAIRRGQLAALATAVLGVLTLNYLYITPRHRLTIAHSQDVIELVVLLIAAVVVGRLAATGRDRAAEAERRARIAVAREREATLLADAASAILAGHRIAAQLKRIGARVEFESVPSPAPDELSIALGARTRPAWLYVARDRGWELADLERVAEPLGRLIDVDVERERVAEQAAETEAARRAEVARTAILHAISHDLRSPLTAITTAASALRTPGVTDSERAELIHVIESSGAQLARLVDDLLDLSKIQGGAVAPEADWCDLRDAVISAAAGAPASSSSCPPTCRSSARMPRSSSGCSRT